MRNRDYNGLSENLGHGIILRVYIFHENKVSDINHPVIIDDISSDKFINALYINTVFLASYLIFYK